MPSATKIYRKQNENHSRRIQNYFSNRQKRGLFDGVGTAVKWLFGTPDAEDADYYTNGIKSLTKNQKKTEILMHRQVSILSFTIANFNSSFIKINENIATLNNNTIAFKTFQTKFANQ